MTELGVDGVEACLDGGCDEEVSTDDVLGAEEWPVCVVEWLTGENVLEE